MKKNAMLSETIPPSKASSTIHVVSARFIKMIDHDFHENMAHLGGLANCPGCVVCKQAKKSVNRVFKHETPAKDP